MGINKQSIKLIIILFLLLLLFTTEQIPVEAAGTILGGGRDITTVTPAYKQNSCENGLKNGNETGIDCGGSCAQANVVDYCDGKDNDKDCMTDEDCKSRAGVVTAPITAKDPSSIQHAEAQNCSDGIQNQGELAVDCGGECIVSANELCDGKDNDKDCYVDEGGVCEAPSAQLQSEDLCAFPDAQIGLESQPTYFAVKSPSCIIEENAGGLKYLSTLNLTKVLNAARPQKETLQSTVALYEGGKGGRCSAIFTAYSDAASAKEAAVSTANAFMPLKKLGNSYAYINETEGVGYWLKGNYIVMVTNFDYPNNHKWEDGCTGLLSAYLAKIGSDLNPASQKAADKQASTIGKTGSPPEECTKTDSDGGKAECRAGSAAIGAGQAPDENGMVTQCNYDTATQTILCNKVKASDMPRIVPDVESEPGVEVAEGATASGKVSSTESTEASEESQAEKIRRIAKQNNIHLSDYNDEKLLDALQKFGNRHRKELEEKYANQEPSDDKLAEILKQFSQEEFAKELNAKQQASQQPQKQSIFGRVKNFFKRLI